MSLVVKEGMLHFGISLLRPGDLFVRYPGEGERRAGANVCMVYMFTKIEQGNNHTQKLMTLDLTRLATQYFTTISWSGQITLPAIWAIVRDGEEIPRTVE